MEGKRNIFPEKFNFQISDGTEHNPIVTEM